MKAVDLGIALLLFAVLSLAYSASFQPAMYGDGPWIVTRCAEGKDHALHPLYLHAAHLLGALGLVPGPVEQLEQLSTAAGALACAALYLAARLLGSNRSGATWASLLLATSPAMWFFATVVEFHAFHCACVVLAALCTLALPWRYAIASCIALALALQPVLLSHSSGMSLLPGWILFAWMASARRGLFWRRSHFLLATAAVAASVPLASLLASELSSASVGFDLHRILSISQHYRVGRESWIWLIRSGFLEPAALLLPAAALSWFLAPPRRRLALAILALLGGAWGAILWLGISERGGYLLGSLPFAALICARMPWRRSGLVVGVASGCILLQGVYAYWGFVAADRGHRIPDRVALVREAMDERALMLSATVRAPALDLYLENTTEVAIASYLWYAAGMGEPPAELVHRGIRGFILLHSRDGAPDVFLDMSYRMEGSMYREFRAYLLALERFMIEELAAERIQHPSWPMLHANSERVHDYLQRLRNR